jgi:putative ABC transport system ATP-binding protein
MSLRAADLSFRFPAGPRVIDGLCLEVVAGESVVVMAPSGTGKTTLLGLLGGLRRPDRGVVTINGDPPDPATVAWVFQRMHLLHDRYVQDNVALPALARGMSRTDAEAAGLDALKAFGVAELADRRAREVSGGQAQRVAMARAAVVRAPVVLMDEPTANLDRVTADGVIEVMFAGFRHAAVVVATHDPAVADHADRTYQLADGRLAGPV